jgi:hypothetical protein
VISFYYVVYLAEIFLTFRLRRLWRVASRRDNSVSYSISSCACPSDQRWVNSHNSHDMMLIAHTFAPAHTYFVYVNPEVSVVEATVPAPVKWSRS